MNGSDRDELEERIALYALGVLARPEAGAVADRIASDPTARAVYDEMRQAVDALALIAEEPVDSTRSTRMRERLLARVRHDAGGTAARPAAATSAVIWGAGLAAAAALAFAIVSVVGDVGVRSDLAATQRRVAVLQAQLAQTARVGALQRQAVTDLLSPAAKHYPVAQGAIIVRGRRIYLALSQLPPPPRGHVYQAWTAAKGTKAMEPSVTFTPNADGVAVVALPIDAANIGTVAVSVEPDGGSKAPTTTPTFVRSLS